MQMTPNSAFIKAAQTCDLDLLEVAIERGADVQAVWEGPSSGNNTVTYITGSYALHIAIRATEHQGLTDNHIKMVERLLQIGVDVNQSHDPRCSSSTLWYAVNSGHEALVRLIVDWGVDLSAIKEENAGVLSLAAEKGFAWLLELLLAPVTITQFDDKTRPSLETALYNAAKAGHIECVKLLLNFGVDVNASHSSRVGGQLSPLYGAIVGKHSEVIELLHCRGAVITIESQDESATLLQAIVDGATNIALEIIGRRANSANSADFFGRSVLQRAASAGYDDVAQALVAAGANLHSRDENTNSILPSAAYSGMNWLVEACLDAGEDVDTQNYYGYTPLMEAAKGGQIETMGLLLKHGAKIGHVSHYHKETPLHYAIEGNQAEAVRWLLERGADCNAITWDVFWGTQSALVQASNYNHSEIVEILIQAGADMEYQDEDDDCHTPLHEAAFNNHLGIVKVLVRYGAEVDTRDWLGFTPLMCSLCGGGCEENVLSVAKHLIENGADVNARDNDGITPLYWAASAGYRAVVEFLLEHGADRHAVTKDGKTPAMMARENWHIRVAELLG
jgi:ankyrin repeat protein